MKTILSTVVAALSTLALVVAQPVQAQQVAPGMDDADLDQLEQETHHFVNAACKIYVYVNTGIKYKGVDIVVKPYTCEYRRARCYKGAPVHSKQTAVCVYSWELQPILTKKGYRKFPAFGAQGCSGAIYYKKFMDKNLRIHIKRVFYDKLGKTQCLNIDKA